MGDDRTVESGLAGLNRPLDTATSGSLAIQSLDAQAALLPYALLLFGVALPIFTWACSFAPDRLWMTASFLIFAINWAAFYGVVDSVKKDPGFRDRIGLRTRIHVMAGLLWAGAVAQVAVMGLDAGAAREPIELLAVGGAAACIFFSSPYLPTLLIVGPAASAAPILALYTSPTTFDSGHIALGAVALVLALSLIFNRLLRRQFTLAEDQVILVRERASSLSQAEALAKSKSDLIATLSHEIRNGLTGVAHVLAAATAGGRSGPSREQMAAALASARDLIEALNATLDTEAAEAGRLTIERQAFDPSNLLRDVVSALRPTAASKGLELSLHIGESLAETGAALGDPARTRQILSNLITNAVKYTVRGRVEVRAERMGDNTVRFEVADTGPGLTLEEIEDAFVPFKRIPRTGAGVSGAGLGLSLSRRLARLMGGDIRAESALSVGSCFRFDLPFDATVQMQRAEGQGLEPPPASGDATSRPLRILTADDDALGSAMLRAVLEQLGHQVLHAHDGRRAAELAQICDVDLVMLSAGIAGMDGPDLVRTIRALDRPIAKAPIITIIQGDPEEARACLAAGADEILRKPVSVGGVARAIAASLREDNAPRPRLVVAQTAAG
ncbi:MAG: ATP-binding protein [Caulobacteraceae bacterium]|nr:ATP-binding protein [Caulobacteraceae bacterium]